MSSTFTFYPKAEDEGQRIDKVLGNIPEIGSRSKAESLLRAGRVRINDQPVKASHRILATDCFSIEIPTPPPSELQPLQLDLEILHEDDDLLVLNKPAGLVVHPAAGHSQDTLVNALLHRSHDFRMKFGENRPGIVHRLDKDTSGLLVVAKNDRSQEALVEQFKSRLVHRRYQAVVINRGSLPKQGSIQSYLARHPSDRKKFASLRQAGRIIQTPGLELPTGKWAKTHYRVSSELPSGLSLLVLKLETGRTHQIRVHLSESGVPIIADPIYNKISVPRGLSKLEENIVASFPRLALHAFELGFQHPLSKKDLFFSQDWPQDLRQKLIDLRLWKAPHEL